MTEREELEEAIAALERQRAVIGDAVVDTALATLRAKLARLDIPEQQLKPVTILFTDVVGSMALSQPLDPEDIHAIIDGDGQQIRNRAFHAVAQYFRLLHQDGSAVLVFLDDLHWADEGSLDFINHMVQACRDLPMMVLCSARPTLYERRPLWASDSQTHERIELGPLSKRSSHDLVESLLGRLAPVPAAVGDVVTSYAEARPVFHPRWKSSRRS
jgi:predicted ATPase